jgi:site-specific DNA-methyltransferase (adenine-specific)
VKPYYSDASVTLYHGDCREVLPALDIHADLIMADPPYGETKLGWDSWPRGWPAVAAATTSSMWCFGSMRMFMDQRDEFGAWKLSQDIVWEKHNGSSFANDRFKRVHEIATHWYRGQWSDIHRDTPTTADATRRTVRRKQRPPHTGEIGRGSYVSDDGGPRLMRSVLQVRSMHGRAIHPTEKPVGLLDPLIRYACPPGGTVLDPFAGSGSTAAACRMSGRRAVLIEADERYCEAIAGRLAQDVLPIGGPA